MTDTINDDYRAVFETEAGRRVLQHLIQECCVFESIWPGGDGAGVAMQAARNDARREVVLSIMTRAGVDFDRMSDPETMAAVAGDSVYDPHDGVAQSGSGRSVPFSEQ